MLGPAPARFCRLRLQEEEASAVSMSWLLSPSFPEIKDRVPESKPTDF